VTDEAAADQFIAAANAFRMQKMGTWMKTGLENGLQIRLGYPSLTIRRQGGEAFEKAASVQREKLNEPDDEANTLTEAFSMTFEIGTTKMYLT
jgi:alpha-soluble NSF attachment protein